ncbi:MAG TPA: PilZ domain-containing protein [Sphingomonadaceae bacterium]|nr:PilZ domain-containing protein [Sphingomonadaceae bacterium]
MPSPQLLRDKARQCAEIANGVADAQIVAVLHKVSAWFEAQATAAAASAPPRFDVAPPPPPPTPRRATRKPVSIQATLRRQGETKFNANVADLSESGFRVESHYLIPMGAQVWLTLPGLAAIPATVAWSSGNSLGCRFDAPLHPAVLDRVIAAARLAA